MKVEKFMSAEDIIATLPEAADCIARGVNFTVDMGSKYVRRFKKDKAGNYVSSFMSVFRFTGVNWSAPVKVKM